MIGTLHAEFITAIVDTKKCPGLIDKLMQT